MNEFGLDTLVISGDEQNLCLAIKLNVRLAPVVTGLPRIAQMTNYFHRIRIIIKACYKILTMLLWNSKYKHLLNWLFPRLHRCVKHHRTCSYLKIITFHIFSRFTPLF